MNPHHIDQIRQAKALLEELAKDDTNGQPVANLDAVLEDITTRMAVRELFGEME